MLKNKNFIADKKCFNTITESLRKGWPKLEQERYIETGSGAFFRDYLYDQVVPKEHFLRKLGVVVDWGRFTQKLIKTTKVQGVVGRPPFDPAIVLEVEGIAYF